MSNPHRLLIARACREADGWPPSNWDQMTSGLQEIYLRKADHVMAALAKVAKPYEEDHLADAYDDGFK